MKDKLEIVKKIALIAGEKALKFSEEGFSVDYKDDDAGPVTDADRAANEYICKELQRHFPNDLVIGEESPPETQEKLSTHTDSFSSIWFVDPIDGTYEFVNQGEEWSVLIGQVSNQIPELGVIYQPKTQKLYTAEKAKGCYLTCPSQEKPQRLEVSRCQTIQEATVVKSKSHPSTEVDQFVEQLGIQKSFPFGSVGLKVALIAEGKADLYFNFSGKCHAWDLCASEVVLSEAGGMICQKNGNPLSYGVDGKTQIHEPFVSGTKRLIPEIIPTTNSKTENRS